MTVANTRAATVTACRRAKLAPTPAVRSRKLLVREGDRVKKGQVLLELWNEDLVAQERLAQDQLTAARLRAEQACLSADLAQRDAERARQLQRQGFISAERVDHAVSEAQTRAVACTRRPEPRSSTPGARIGRAAPTCRAQSCARRSTAWWPK